MCLALLPKALHIQLHCQSPESLVCRRFSLVHRVRNFLVLKLAIFKCLIIVTAVHLIKSCLVGVGV